MPIDDRVVISFLYGVQNVVSPPRQRINPIEERGTSFWRGYLAGIGTNDKTINSWELSNRAQYRRVIAGNA